MGQVCSPSTLTPVGRPRGRSSIRRPRTREAVHATNWEDECSKYSCIDSEFLQELSGQELSGPDHTYAESSNTREIPNVMRDDRVASRYHRQFQYQIILRILQCGPPQKMHLLAMGHQAQLVNDIDRHRCRDADALSRKHVLILKHQRDRDCSFEPVAPHQRQEMESSVPPRTKRGHENVGVEDDSRGEHDGVISDTALVFKALEMVQGRCPTF